MIAQRRYYFRCPLCLTIGAVEAPTFPSGLTCAVCVKPVEKMGRVEGRRLVHDGLEVPCDSRCTNARGPKCDCPCSGDNHGTGLLVPVTYDAGAVPQITPLDVEGARLRAAQWGQLKARAVEALEARFARVLALKRDGRYLGEGDYTAYLVWRDLRTAVSDAGKMKTHGGRVRRVEQILKDARLRLDCEPVGA